MNTHSVAIRVADGPDQLCPFGVDLFGLADHLHIAVRVAHALAEHTGMVRHVETLAIRARVRSIGDGAYVVSWRGVDERAEYVLRPVYHA